MKKSIVSAVVTLCLLTGGLILYFQNRRDVPVSESGGPSAVSRKQGPFSFIPRGWVEKSSYVDYFYLPRQTIEENFDAYLSGALEEKRFSTRIRKVAVMAAVASYTDMEKAFELLDTLSSRRSSAIHIMLDYVSGDEHLASLLSKFEENGDREDLLTVGSWASSLVTAQKVGLDRLLELASMFRRQELVEGLASNAGRASASKTPEELPQLPEGAAGPFFGAYAQARSEISREDVVWLVNQHPSHVFPILNGAFTHILNEYGGLSAVELLNTVEIEEAKAKGYQCLATRWAMLNSIEASQWVDSLPPGRLKDVAIEGMLTGIPQDSRRQAAEAWINRVQDPRIKEVIVTYYLSDSE